MLLVVEIDELPTDKLFFSGLRSANCDSQRNQIVRARFFQTRAHCRDRNIARSNTATFHFYRILIEETEITDRSHYRRVAGVTKRFVFHRGNLPLVAERHRRQPASSMESFELADRRGKYHGLALGQGLY